MSCGHSITKCKYCSKIIAQCRCADNNKPVEYKICGECKNGKLVTGETSDGYHTFNELYDHRCLLWINLCRIMSFSTYLVENHFDGWFLLGMDTEHGQISYHCPNKYLDLVSDIPRRHPPYDGHTSKDVVERLSKIPFKANIGSPKAVSKEEIEKSLAPIPSTHYPISMIAGRHYYYMCKDDIVTAVHNLISMGISGAKTVDRINIVDLIGGCRSAPASA